jgi:hypothetical protein
VYPCGCYQYSKIRPGYRRVSLEELEHPEAVQLADMSEAEGCKRTEQVCSLKITYNGF